MEGALDGAMMACESVMGVGMGWGWDGVGCESGHCALCMGEGALHIMCRGTINTVHR